MNLSSGLYSWLPAAKPGWKIYGAASVDFEYMVGAGQTEPKWNSDKKIFENVVANGALAHEKSDPIVMGIIEFK